MIKKGLIISQLLIFATISNCQVTKIDTSNGVTNETYYIDNNGLKQGKYLLKYGNETQVSGSYINNKKTGKWVYKPDNAFKITGYYKAGKKDSTWSYYRNNFLCYYRNFNTGESRSYYDNGKILTKSDSVKGTYQFEEYFKKGQLKMQEVSDSGLLTRKKYDKKGHLTEHIILKNGIPYEIIKSTDNGNGVIYGGKITKGTGTVEIKHRFTQEEFNTDEKVTLVDSKPNGEYVNYNEDGKIYAKGNYQNGFMVGSWEKYKNSSQQPDTTINYSINDSIAYDSKNYLGFKTLYAHFIVSDMPYFLGESIDSFRKFVYQHLKYPEKAAKEHIEGRIFVQFSIDTNGELVDAKIVRGSNELLKKEALRVTNLSPYWRPGMQDGIPVKVQLTFPILFFFK